MADIEPTSHVPADGPTSNPSSIANADSTISHAFSGLSSQPPHSTEGSWTPDTSEHSDAQHLGEDTKRQGAPLVIEETEKEGKYTITADDADIREILRARAEREAGKLKGKARPLLRDLVFTRQFTTFDRQNPRASQSPFHGFFTLFWLVLAIQLIKIAAQNYKTEGTILGKAEILHLMVDRDLIPLFITDGIMCFATSFGFFLQKAIANGYLTWNRSGWAIQSVWELFFTVSVIFVSFYREWPWTHTVFIVLHVFILLMKQHAYAFYNGYLSQVFRRRKLLQQKLAQVDKIEPRANGPPISPTTEAAFSTGLHDTHPDQQFHHRRSIGPKYSTNLTNEESEVASMAKAVEAGKPLDAEQISIFKRVLDTEITVLSEELRGKCTTTDNVYPKNLTVSNLVEWTCLPTLAYELEYPRLDTINWWYVAEKSAATLGVIWIMIIISQAYVYPVVVETLRHKESGMPLEQRWKQLPWVVSDMLLPLLVEHLLAWYVIWECLLNVLAEVTRFADRGFYGDWWNSVSWDQYARDWNRPVHSFLLRHVYHSSISAFHLSKMEATFFTFLLSAIFHEVLMFCLFKKVRGYLFVLQLSQIPLAAMSRTRLMKGRDLLGNIIFWFGLFIGPSLITGLYLVV